VTPASAGGAVAIALLMELVAGGAVVSAAERQDPGVRPAIGTPVPSAAGDTVVRWVRASMAVSMSDLPVARLRRARFAADSVVAWEALASDSTLRLVACHRLAPLCLSLGDSARADTLWEEVARGHDPWQWEAVRARSELALARGDTVRAEVLLEMATRRDWTEGERGEWLAGRVRLRTALRDTAAAVGFARQLIRRYPALPGTPAVLDTLQRLLASRADSLTAEDERLAAEVELFRPDRSAALRRLANAAARWKAPDGWRLELRRAQILRGSRRFAAAQQVLDTAVARAPGRPDSAACLIERARSYRDAGMSSEALGAYEEAAGDSSQRPTAWWERAGVLEDAAQWARARDDYARVAALGGRRRDDAALRAGLMSLAAGEPIAALDAWSHGSDEACRFWWAVVLRRSDAAGSDSLLRLLAARPGYSFYRAAARETLGVRGWPARVPELRAAPDDGTLRQVRALTALGLGEDAAAILDRWAGVDPRPAPGDRLGVERTPAVWLDAAALAYQGGRPRQAIRLAERAVAALADSETAIRWSASSWLYPPAYDSLFAAFPERAAADAPDRALLQAVTWKESRFDAQARSRSDAIGLLQLKRPAVTDVAGWLHEPVPNDSALLEPGLNLRYGARYLERQLRRFPGNLPLALAAYNAGSRVAVRWTRLRAIGGDALACEEIAFPETQDYVKTILAVRQAYRELRPVLAVR
jgi:soluble lytic murein transglycosylase-like protein/Tfp pilus assembly protein PilF